MKSETGEKKKYIKADMKSKKANRWVRLLECIGCNECVNVCSVADTLTMEVIYTKNNWFCISKVIIEIRQL